MRIIVSADHYKEGGFDCSVELTFSDEHWTGDIGIISSDKDVFDRLYIPKELLKRVLAALT